jgi:hypothetical protein
MSGEYYVRIRGRVHGPLTLQKLHNLVQKGQLSRIHEISPDGRSWQPAAKMAELFTSPASVTAPSTGAAGFSPAASEQTESFVDLSKGSDPRDVWDGNSAAAIPSESWYYAIGGAQQGPVSTAQLIDLIRTVTVTPSSMVWKNDMDTWTEASNVATLIPHFQSRARSQANPHLNNSGATTSNRPTDDGFNSEAISTGRFEDVVNFELQKWSGSLLLAQIAAILAGLLSIVGGIFCVLAFVVSVQFSTIVIGLLNMTVGGMTLMVGIAMVKLRRQVNDAALKSSGESIMHAIRAVTPVWKILAWTLITTIVLSTLAVFLMAIAAIISAGPLDDR